MDHYARAYPIYGKIRGWRWFQGMLFSLRRFGREEVAVQRLKIIKFYERFGEKATKEAFGADRKVISRWRKRLREKHPRLGKEKLKPLLDKYCRERGLKPISESSIGNIIKRHKFFYQKSGRIYHDPNSK